MQRLRQAELDIQTPVDAAVDGKPVRVLAVVDRTVVFERDGSRHVALLESVEVDRVEFIEHRDPGLGTGERGRANAATIQRWRRTRPHREPSEAQHRAGWE